jgi:hypothetical protein
MRFEAWAIKPITGGLIRKPSKASVEIAATLELGAAPGTRDAAAIIIGIVLGGAAAPDRLVNLIDYTAQNAPIPLCAKAYIDIITAGIITVSMRLI